MCAERQKRAWDAEWDLKFNGWALDWGLILLIGISSFFLLFFLFPSSFIRGHGWWVGWEKLVGFGGM